MRSRTSRGRSNRSIRPASSIATAVDEQKDANGEISRSFQQVAEVSAGMNQNVEGLSGAATKTGQVSQEVAEVAKRLQENLASLESNAKAFVDQILAA